MHNARLPALIPSVRVAVLRVHRLRVLVQDLVVNQENEGAKVQEKKKERNTRKVSS